MSRTSNLKLTGAAAHGHDDIMDIPSDYAQRLRIASDAVKKIIDDDMSYVSLIMRVPDDEMLDTLETIISQCQEWDAQPTPAEVKAATYAMCENYEMRFMNKRISIDGTYYSPIIDGGEIRELTSYLDNSDTDEEMPF